MRAYHGSASPQTFLAPFRSSPRYLTPRGQRRSIYVTDTAERAQLYADAQATHVVETEPRYASFSAVVEVEIPDATSWLHREKSHATLDLCEACVSDYEIIHVTLYLDLYAIDHAVIYVDHVERNYVNWLREQLGERLSVEETT